MVRLTDVIAPVFFNVHRDIKKHQHTHYWLKGGRGSTKSSFASLEIIVGLMRDGQMGKLTHAMILRRFGVTLRESVFAQMIWAINTLGVSDLFKSCVSPMQLIYLPTGQKILFRGVDDATKIKSIKVSNGYIKYVWYEEVNEFEGAEKLRSINQSLLRGGSRFVVFYSFNPPKQLKSWVNQEILILRDDRLVHHSSYLDVPENWLGEQFLVEAEHLKNVKIENYNHEYLGIATGTGGEVFDNVVIERIDDAQIKKFDRIKRGVDWGYAADPFCYVACHFDKTRRTLYVFFEIFKVRLSNREAARLVLNDAGRIYNVVCDCAEPKSIAEFKDFGIRAKGARKGPDSIAYGIKFLQDLEKIVIDPQRCPNVQREFTSYELERDRHGNFKSGYSDKDNHTIDAIRYALEDETIKPNVGF